MSTDLTWNEEVWCVTCGSTDRTRKYHRGHVISRSDMNGYLPWLNRVSRSMRHRQYRDNESWNIVSQCRECNHATHAGQAAINHPSSEREALWAAINLHNEIRISLHGAVGTLNLLAVATAAAEQRGETIDPAQREQSIKTAVDEAVRALGIIEGALDLPTLRSWHSEFAEVAP